MSQKIKKNLMILVILILIMGILMVTSLALSFGNLRNQGYSSYEIIRNGVIETVIPGPALDDKLEMRFWGRNPRFCLFH